MHDGQVIILYIYISMYLYYVHRHNVAFGIPIDQNLKKKKANPLQVYKHLDKTKAKKQAHGVPMHMTDTGYWRNTNNNGKTNT